MKKYKGGDSSNGYPYAVGVTPTPLAAPTRTETEKVVDQKFDYAKYTYAKIEP